MQTRTYKLYATGSASANATAQLIIQRRGIISAVYASFVLDSVVDNTSAFIELSTQSVAMVSTNDTVGPITEVRLYANFVTSGLSVGGANSGVSGIAIPVDQGTRLYVNTVITGTGNFYGSFYIHVAE